MNTGKSLVLQPASHSLLCSGIFRNEQLAVIVSNADLKVSQPTHAAKKIPGDSSMGIRALRKLAPPDEEGKRSMEGRPHRP